MIDPASKRRLFWAQDFKFEILDETEKAFFILVTYDVRGKLDGRQMWLPKSAIKTQTGPVEVKGCEMFMCYVQRWLLTAKYQEYGG